ncbi:bifunctional 2-polyprenyl-6-hydroxyphenol methylase/3-demethylubiquinol 3-O-methyltransferase UbiG [Chitinophaga sp. XS-30]|uniref:class I SAM-dependent methyltransferase n=1 Tax=Chitinophaga sp. XS-30 TaxID=2604421 RepID=UPI0011DCCE17|nr:methyltransferase domain-containing protein [Chitinophaga sp. XS-30]QEH43435.1 methyltransferase domain-containing protein [Chitinophaga sp. XS-30]
MSLPQHSDATLRYQQQVENSRNYVLPFIAQEFPDMNGLRVMEIGCGEGGVLTPFLEKGCHCVGVDLFPERIALATGFLGDYVNNGQLQLIAKNIYDVDFFGEFQHAFDLIILKDAIEHIPEQDKLVAYLKNLLSPRGQVYFGFPPWYMPHGGHQQICQSKVLSFLPYIHLLPRPLYRGLLKAFGEHEGTVRELMELVDTGISIERFEKVVKAAGFDITQRKYYLINPIYKYKFKLQPREQFGWMKGIPFVRNFFTTCMYYMIRPEAER